MKEKYGFYKVYDDSIKEITEQINQNMQILNIDYKKDYEETIKIIKAFYAYKSFVIDYLAKSIEIFINREKSKYKDKTDINDFYDDFYNEFNNLRHLEFQIVAISNGELTYDKYDNILVNNSIHFEFCGYIQRMMIRQKFYSYFMRSDYQSRIILGLDNEYDKLFFVSRFSALLSIKDLIDCYYNELQALELMEEEINILKEDYQIKDDISLERKIN